MQHRNLIGIELGPAGEEGADQAGELIQIASQVMMRRGSIDESIHAGYKYAALADLYRSTSRDGSDDLAKQRGSNG